MLNSIAIDEKRLERDLKYRVDHLKEFVGWTADDEAMIKNTIGKLARHAEKVVDSIYDHLFRWSSTAKYFVDKKGRLRQAFLTKRKETLTNWLVRVGKGEVDLDFAKYIADVGHKHRADDGEVPMEVPRHYFIALMSVVQTGVTNLLAMELPDKDEYRRAVVAWNKMLMLVLELLFHGWANKKKPA